MTPFSKNKGPFESLKNSNLGATQTLSESLLLLTIWSEKRAAKGHWLIDLVKSPVPVQKRRKCLFLRETVTMTEFNTWAFPQEVEENCLLSKGLLPGSYHCGNITIISVHAELYVSELSPRFCDWINLSLGIFPCDIVMRVMCLYYLKCLYESFEFKSQGSLRSVSLLASKVE